MQIEELTKKIIYSIMELSVNEIIEIDDVRTGLTIFKPDGLILVTPGFTVDNRHDSAVRSYWERLYGACKHIWIYGGGEDDVYEMAYYDDEREGPYECEHDEKLQDPSWVKAYAAQSRAAMIYSAEQSADCVIDFFNEDDWPA